MSIRIEPGSQDGRFKMWPKNNVAYTKHYGQSTAEGPHKTEGMEQLPGRQKKQEDLIESEGSYTRPLLPDLADTQSRRVEGDRPQREQKPDTRVQAEVSACDSGRSGWWGADPAEDGAEPRLGRMAHGVANRVDRLKAIGNGQVPAVAAAAWRILNQGLS